jgi:hypothetical protein
MPSANNNSKAMLRMKGNAKICLRPSSMPPPIAISWDASWRRAPCTRAHRPNRTAQVTATISSEADTASSGATPITSTIVRVSNGPVTAPTVPATAMMGNRRRDCSSLQMSAMKLQNTDTTNRLNTLTQTKNTVPSARGLNSPGG